MWQERARCRDTDTEVFFDPERYPEAFAVCGGCEVSSECYNFASKHDAVGVWGGRLVLPPVPVVTVHFEPWGISGSQLEETRIALSEPFSP